MPLGLGRKAARSAAAEFVAMTLFVFIGCGTAVSVQTQQYVNGIDAGPASDDFLTAVALAFGIAIAVLVYTIASYSGGHINPAVTLAFLILRKLTIAETVVYWIAQMLGSLLGAAILWGCTASADLEAVAGKPPFLLASNFVSDFETTASAFLIECMGTFVLVWTVMMTAVSPKSMAGNLAPIAIGWSVFLAHLVLIPYTGCGINPARSFGPHVVSSMAGVDVSVRGTWIFYTAPFVGSIFATLLGMFFMHEEKIMDEEKAAEREEQMIDRGLISNRVPGSKPATSKAAAGGASKMERVEEEGEEEEVAEVAEQEEPAKED